MLQAARGTALDEGPLVAVRDGAWCCLLCERRFKSDRHMGRHLARSDLHKVGLAWEPRSHWPHCALHTDFAPIRLGVQEAYAAATSAGRVVEPSGATKRNRDGEHGSDVLRPSEAAVAVGVGSSVGVSAIEQMELVQQRLAAVSKVQKRQPKAAEDEIDSNRVSRARGAACACGSRDSQRVPPHPHPPPGALDQQPDGLGVQRVLRLQLCARGHLPAVQAPRRREHALLDEPAKGAQAGAHWPAPARSHRPRPQAYAPAPSLLAQERFARVFGNAAPGGQGGGPGPNADGSIGGRYDRDARASFQS